MTFLYPLLLGGLVAVGLPILLHLLMRQKPKHVMFPAFRFLQQKAKRNQRKIRLRHLLLLLLRMLLLALVCLALARPRFFSDRVGPIVGANQAAAAVLVVDTSLSMDYQSGGKSRLDDAKQRALELLDEFSESSRVAIVDTSDPTREWLSVAQAREKVRGLNTKAGSQAVTTALPAAYALFDELDRDASGETEALPRFIYVLSDRTVAAWDPARVPDLITQRDRVAQPDAQGKAAVASYFIDVGVEKPADVAISSVDLKPQSVPTNQDVVIKTFVTATGQACDGELVCKVLGEPTADRKPIKLEAGQTDVVEFRRKGLKPGQYQAELTLAPTDALPANNARYVTFEVRVARKVVIITDDEDYARYVEAAILSAQEFDCDTVTPDKIQSADDLKPYRAAFLLSVRRPADVWAKLEAYVAGGGHLLVMPGRDETVPAEYTPAASKNLLPAALDKPVAVPGEKGAAWKFGNYKHPLLKKFGDWDQAGVSFMRRPRTANKYWSVKSPDNKPLNRQNVIVSYALKDDPPALLERAVDRAKGAGRVLLFTTSFDDRGKVEPPWNNYAVTIDAPFLVPVVNEALKYCAGSLEDITFNYTSGQALALPLPLDARFPEYQIDGPGLSGADTKLGRAESDAELRIRQTDHAGNYVVSRADWKAQFSLNPPANEFVLDRVAPEEIERLFGPDSVVAAESNKKITTAIGGKTRQPIDLFATLMVLFVLAFCVECFLANRFYKAEPSEGQVSS